MHIYTHIFSSLTIAFYTFFVMEKIRALGGFEMPIGLGKKKNKKVFLLKNSHSILIPPLHGTLQNM